MNDSGILLCAVGSQKFYTLCNTIIRDLRETMPGIKICVYTDNRDRINNADHFIEGSHNPELIFLSKIKACQRSPFEQTIFIDVDSRVLRPIDHLFKILDTHDLGLTFANARGKLKEENWNPNEAGLPLCSSTLLFKKSQKILNLFDKWEREYVKQELFPGHGDQYYLKYLVYKDTDIRYFTLPDEYHFNSDHPTFVAGNVRILTSLVSDMDKNGGYSRSKLDKIFNPPDIDGRLIYIKLLGGPKWKKRISFLPKRLVVFMIHKTSESKVTKLIKNLIPQLK